jgi:pyridinium-3,5-biscarboxylic acid mononucleotide sulfurtransferase
LLEAGLGKEEIRQLSRELGLPTADKPPYACLASRFPYGTRLTQERLKSVDRVEQVLGGLGFRQVRVRYHGDVARIEVDPAEILRLCAADVREAVLTAALDAGFRYAAVDLRGYRTGSLNEGLPQPLE